MGKRKPAYLDTNQQIGGFDFRHGHHRPTAISARVPLTRHSESAHQVDFFATLAMNERRWPILEDFYHVPNGGHRQKAVAQQLRREGVKPGIHDIHLDAARRGFHGLRLELKVEENDLTEEQKRVRRRLIEEGYCAHTCWHVAELLSISLWYLEIPRAEFQAYPSRHCIILPRKGGHNERCGCGMTFLL